MASRSPIDPVLTEVGENLVAAHASGDQVRAADIIDRWGPDLAYTPYGGVVFDVATELPIELADGRPGLAFRFEDIGRLPIGSTSLDLPTSNDEARAEYAKNGDLRLRQALLPLTTRRRLGRYDEALAIVEAAEPLAQAVVYPWYGDRGQILPYWHLQAGICAMFAGELAKAGQYLLAAWTHRARDPYGFVVRDTAGKLALLAAFTGDLAAATTWLQQARESPRREDLWTDSMIESSLHTATAILQVDQVRPLVDARLRAEISPALRGALWPVSLWVSALDALTVGDTGRAASLIDEARQAQHEDVTSTGLAARIIRLVQAEIYLSTGEPEKAAVEAADLPDVAGLARTLRARILLVTNQALAALVELDALSADPAVSLRARHEALVLSAAAHEAWGNRRAAIAAARQAAARATEHGAVRAFMMPPRALLEALVPDVPGLAAILAQLDEAGVRKGQPRAAKPVSVTRRERDLLRALGSGRTLGEISAQEHVTLNTTRTHLASLRRKLDARNRDEVLRKAQLLGLLD